MAAGRTIPELSVAAKMTKEAPYLHENVFVHPDLNRNIEGNAGGASVEPEGERWAKLNWITCHGAPFAAGVGMARCAVVHSSGIAFAKWQVAVDDVNRQQTAAFLWAVPGDTLVVLAGTIVNVISPTDPTEAALIIALADCMGFV